LLATKEGVAAAIDQLPREEPSADVEHGRHALRGSLAPDDEHAVLRVWAVEFTGPDFL
jgi:hypothetical protein